MEFGSIVSDMRQMLPNGNHGAEVVTSVRRAGQLLVIAVPRVVGAPSWLMIPPPSALARYIA